MVTLGLLLKVMMYTEALKISTQIRIIFFLIVTLDLPLKLLMELET